MHLLRIRAQQRSGPDRGVIAQVTGVAVNDLGDGSHPSPAVADEKIFLVGMNNIYCIANKD